MSSLFFSQNKTAKITDISGNGYLYNHSAATQLAPENWKLPEKEDFQTLLDYLKNNGFDYSGRNGRTNVAKSLSKHGNWAFSTSTGSPGHLDYQSVRNKTGFSALPSGMRTEEYIFYSTYANFWSASIYSGNYYTCLVISYNSGKPELKFMYKNRGLSVRLIYDGTGSPTSVSDYEGNVYDVVKIGDQYWTVQNWKSNRTNNGEIIEVQQEQSLWGKPPFPSRLCYYNNNEDYI